jgi:hypothetical protein
VIITYRPQENVHRTRFSRPTKNGRVSSPRSRTRSRSITDPTVARMRWHDTNKGTTVGMHSGRDGAHTDMDNRYASRLTHWFTYQRCTCAATRWKCEEDEGSVQNDVSSIRTSTVSGRLKDAVDHAPSDRAPYNTDKPYIYSRIIMASMLRYPLPEDISLRPRSCLNSRSNPKSNFL